jgi:hypothetical protein
MERQLVIIEGEQKNVAPPCDEHGQPAVRSSGVDLPEPRQPPARQLQA